MTTNIRARQPEGTPIGGQFATMQKPEAGITLNDPSFSFFDGDGTPWGIDYEDEYSHVLANVEDGLRARACTDIRADNISWQVIDERRPRTRPLKNSILAEGTAATMDEAQDAAKEARQEAAAHGFTGLRVGSGTPRGEVISIQPLAAGIDSVSTTGHGYIALSKERNEAVDPVWRRNRGLYEEDCDWSIPTLTYHQFANPQLLAAAHETARRYMPREYTKAVSKDPARYGLTEFKPITHEESFVLKEEDFWDAHRDTHVSIQGVVGDARYPDHSVVTVTNPPRHWADDARTGRHTILVPKDEYYSYFENGSFGAIPRDHGYTILEEKAA